MSRPLQPLLRGTIKKAAGPLIDWPRGRPILTGLIAAVLVLTGLFIKWLSGPAEGQISPASNTVNNQTLNSGDSTEYIRVDGRYISFAHSKNYRLEKGETSVVILEAYSLITKAKATGISRTIAITVFDLPSSKLADNSAYKIRKDNPGLYKEETAQINGERLVVFRKIDEPATVAFWQRGNKLATIGFSGSVQTPEAQKEYDYLLNSWEWL